MTDSFDIRNSAFGICPVPPKGNANFAWVQHFNRTKSSTLATLRGTLLPKMLNGEVSVDELNTDHVATP